MRHLHIRLSLYRCLQYRWRYDYVDGLTWAEAQDSNELRTVFRDGKFEKQFTLDEIRKNLHGGTF